MPVEGATGQVIDYRVWIAARVPVPANAEQAIGTALMTVEQIDESREWLSRSTSS